MQNTYQEKSPDPISKDFLFGKKLEGGIKLSTVSDFKPAGDQVVRNLLQGMVKKYRPESTRQTSPKKSDSPSTSGTKPSSFNKGASKQKEAAGKNTNTKVSPVKKSDAGSVWGKLPKK